MDYIMNDRELHLSFVFISFLKQLHENMRIHEGLDRKDINIKPHFEDIESLFTHFSKRTLCCGQTPRDCRIASMSLCISRP